MRDVPGLVDGLLFGDLQIARHTVFLRDRCSARTKRSGDAVRPRGRVLQHANVAHHIAVVRKDGAGLRQRRKITWLLASCGCALLSAYRKHPASSPPPDFALQVAQDCGIVERRGSLCSAYTRPS